MDAHVTEEHILAAQSLALSRMPRRASHDATHAQRVHNLAVTLARAHPHALNLPLIRISALVHDLFDDKLTNDTDGSQRLYNLLQDIGLDQQAAQQTVFICANVSYSKGSVAEDKRTGELDVVQDADRLDAIGAVGIARCMAYAGETEGTLWDARRHFDDKLKALMRTAKGREMAEKRHATLITFMQAFDTELEQAGQTHEQVDLSP